MSFCAFPENYGKETACSLLGTVSNRSITTQGKTEDDELSLHLQGSAHSLSRGSLRLEVVDRLHLRLGNRWRDHYPSARPVDRADRNRDLLSWPNSP